MNAREAIMEAYDKDVLKEIASHGCESGVCHEHIYYGDTNEYYNKYEDEITSYLTDNYGTEFLVSLFKKADASLTTYKNDVTWAYIEAIAFNVIQNEIAELESLLQPV